MEVQEFVNQTIQSVILAVRNLQNDQNFSRHVCPSAPAGQDKELGYGNHSYIKNLEFDISVIVEESKGSQTAGTVKVCGFGVGGDITKTQMQNSISRIKFSIPIGFDDAHLVKQGKSNLDSSRAFPPISVVRA